MIQLSLQSTLFPYTTLFRSWNGRLVDWATLSWMPAPGEFGRRGRMPRGRAVAGHNYDLATTQADRKSTRLNSSHANISYAVFCLKKKKKFLILLFVCILYLF